MEPSTSSRAQSANLESDRLAVREAPEVPPRIEYALTALEKTGLPSPPHVNSRKMPELTQRPEVVAYCPALDDLAAREAKHLHG